METTYEGEGENRKMVIHGNPFVNSATPTTSNITAAAAVSAPEIYENYVK